MFSLIETTPKGLNAMVCKWVFVKDHINLETFSGTKRKQLPKALSNGHALIMKKTYSHVMDSVMFMRQSSTSEFVHSKDP